MGSIWSSYGTLLARVTFSGETASGWQQMKLSTPLKVTANFDSRQFYSFFQTIDIDWNMWHEDTYRETLRDRTGGPLPDRLAAALVQVAAPGRPRREGEPELAALVERELLAAQERLREVFGVAALPDDVRPSDAVNRQ